MAFHRVSARPPFPVGRRTGAAVDTARPQRYKRVAGSLYLV